MDLYHAAWSAEGGVFSCGDSRL